MANQNNIRDLFNTTAYDRAGDKLGDVQEVFVDDNSGQPTFVEVKHGLFGMSSSLVPLRGHKLQGSDLQLAFSKDRIKDAPSIDADQGLTPEEQNRIFEHYDVAGAQDQNTYVDDHRRPSRENDGQRESNDRNPNVDGAAAGTVAGGAGTMAAGSGNGPVEHGHDRDVNADRDRHAGAADDNSVIRSEERMDVNKERVATGKARLRKYVVEDKETVEVPVTREEVRVERTPISEDEAANFRGEIGEDEASTVLHEERVDVQKRTVPVEKVALDKQQVTDTERHTETLAKEQVETDADIDGRDRR